MLTIYAVSDSIGETAEQVAQAAASQFDDEIEVKRVPYIKTLEDVEELIGEIREINNVMIVSTIITVNVREYLTQKGVENNIWVVNVLGPIINVSSSILNKQPQYNPGAMWKTDETYFKRIEAMEFAMQYDDSKDYRGLKNADVVLIGLSRTSKTPLCMYLANKGIKAINIPLVPEVGVPDEIYEVDRDRIFALTIDPMQLIEIRKRRLDKFHRIPSNIEYAGDAYDENDTDIALFGDGEQKTAEKIARYNPLQCIKAMCGIALEKYHAMEHEYPSKIEVIDKYGYDPKQLSHLVRIEEFLVRYTAGEPFKDCLISQQAKFLKDLKFDDVLSIDCARLQAEESLEHIEKLYDSALDRFADTKPNEEVEQLLNDVQCQLIERNLTKYYLEKE